MKDQIHSFFKEYTSKFSWRRIWLFVIIVVALCGMFFVSMVAYAHSYDNRVLPGVQIGEVPVGGMDRIELKLLLQDMNDKLINEGITFAIQKKDGQKEFTLFPVVVTETNSLELVYFDVDTEVEYLVGLGKEGDILGRAMTVLQSRIGGKKVRLSHVGTEREKILETVENFISPYITEAQDASVSITNFDPFMYEVRSSSLGVTYDYSHIVEDIVYDWSNLRVPQIGILERFVEEPDILDEYMATATRKLENMFTAGSLQLKHTDPSTARTRTWTVSNKELAEFLTLTHDTEHGYIWELHPASTTEYLIDTIAESVNIRAQDAKFEVNADGRVVAFQGSRPGVELDVDATFKELNEAFRQRNWHEEGLTKTVPVVTKQSEPIVKTGEVNDLGISEILGIGVSSYSGSPSNRIKNIRNAVNKLNGVLVPPGEEFSTIAHTQPYTLEGGYLPELVIKGDEIKPEIGGGLCQIGTTLFRMAMNSGLEIVERRNHSLVVNYYNDLQNGLPGTDATIYDPAPDFRFKNDTGHYILIQTTMDEVNQDLIFTIWGTRDGRRGSYTPPVVNRWIPYGETRIIETTKLPAGTKECQHAYRGADTAFTYTRLLADGTKEETLFESHYRPLPQICLVGIEEPVETVCEEGEPCLSEKKSEIDSDEISMSDVSNPISFE